MSDDVIDFCIEVMCDDGEPICTIEARAGVWHNSPAYVDDLDFAIEYYCIGESHTPLPEHVTRLLVCYEDEINSQVEQALVDALELSAGPYDAPIYGSAIGGQL